MQLKFYPTIVFRTPKFSYQSELTACWEELKTDISISSDAFYQTIKEVKADELSQLPPKVFFTIWKYFNRAKYRSTPYGTFASFSLLKEAIKTKYETIKISKQQQVHELIDWPHKNNISFDIQSLLEQNCLLFSNSSYYLSANSIRYIACADGVFELAEIDYDVLVKQILDICLKPIRLRDLFAVLKSDPAEQETLLSLIGDMHALQLIFTDHDPNIIGEDYFERIKLKEKDNLPRYIISERKVHSGNIPEDLLKHTTSLIHLLHKLMPAAEKNALKNFVNRFKKKFEQREVPLLLALDPEMGVGYDELEQAEQTDDFIAQFKNKPTEKQMVNDLKSVFKKHVQGINFEKGQPLLLNKMVFDLNEKPIALPNSFNLMMSVSDDLIFIDQIGGATANTLSGRFTMADGAIAQYCKEIAEIEQHANPDVLFFDVAYIAETNVDNVNRRKQIYDHQLSILNFDTSENPLQLNDITIAVQGEEVVLRSVKLSKRLVPKMASAYNYTRSDLSVFRMLCDLQHQNIQTGLGITLSTIFPDLDYYPRVQYHNIILNRAGWKISKDQLFKLKGKEPDIEECRTYLQDLQVCRYFKTGISDQTLCFDLESDNDLKAFIQYLQKQRAIYVEEIMLPEQSLVQDEQVKPYLAQFVLNVYHEEKIYNALPNFSAEIASDVTQVFPPGREWLYCEIYCHQQRSDQILAGAIAYFLDQHQADIKHWFFIRYNENGNHLRFRVLLNNAKDGQKLTAALSDYLEEDLKAGLVSDLQVKTYKRESERYGNDLIEGVEYHFFRDSEFVLSLLESQISAFSKYKICADVAYKVQEAGLFDQKIFPDIIKIFSDGYNTEHHLEAPDFKKLNAQYLLYKKEEEFELNETQLITLNRFTRSFISLLEKCPQKRRMKLFGDLIHMHVNRLFIKDQRTHEMVMYYFLLKDLQRRLHSTSSIK